jgi:TonB family protein
LEGIVHEGINSNWYGFPVRRAAEFDLLATIRGNQPGGPATAAHLNAPLDIAVDTAGNLFIADTQNSRIRKVTPAGVITTVAGNGTQGFSGDGGPATSAKLNDPSGVAVDTAGSLFIADSSNNRIRKVTPDGVISTVAGNGSAGYSGDGGPATTAQLNSLGGVAVDTAGNLFIADSGNNCVRKVTTSGVINTIAGTKLYFVGSGVTEPEAIENPRPAYTDEAKKNRVDGFLILQAIVRANGRVDSFKVIKSLGFGLDESAINTIATKWRFKPGTFKGVPVDVQVNITVTFRLYE